MSSDAVVMGGRVMNGARGQRRPLEKFFRDLAKRGSEYLHDDWSSASLK